MFLKSCRTGYAELVAAKRANLTAKEQSEILDECDAQLKSLRENSAFRSLLTTTELKRANNRYRGRRRESAFVSVPKRVTRLFFNLGKLRDLVENSRQELKNGPVLPVLANAAKVESEYLTAEARRFWNSIADGSRVHLKSRELHAFAKEVFEFIEGKPISLDAVRMRLRAQEGQAAASGSDEPLPVVDRDLKEVEWRAEFKDELLKDPTVSETEAEILASDIAVDLSRDPRAAARKLLRDEKK